MRFELVLVALAIGIVAAQSPACSSVAIDGNKTVDLSIIPTAVGLSIQQGGGLMSTYLWSVNLCKLSTSPPPGGKTCMFSPYYAAQYSTGGNCYSTADIIVKQPFWNATLGGFQVGYTDAYTA